MCVLKTLANSGPKLLADLSRSLVDLAPRVGERPQQIGRSCCGSPERRVLDVREIERVLEPVDRTDRDPGARKPIPRSSTFVLGSRLRRLGRDRHAGARELVDMKRARSLVGTGDQVEQPRVHHDRREQLATGLEQLDVGRAEAPRDRRSGSRARRS